VWVGLISIQDPFRTMNWQSGRGLPTATVVLVLLLVSQPTAVFGSDLATAPKTGSASQSTASATANDPKAAQATPMQTQLTNTNWSSFGTINSKVSSGPGLQLQNHNTLGHNLNRLPLCHSSGELFVFEIEPI
jgi:hypothetical protein